MNAWLVFFVMLQEQETLSFIRENLEKSDQLTKNMVRRCKHTLRQLRLTLACTQYTVKHIGDEEPFSPDPARPSHIVYEYDRLAHFHFLLQ